MRVKINKSDYDSYCVPIHLDNLFGKRKMAFINDCLDKLHPCFSEKDFVDYKLKFGIKGINALVTVLDKMTLANYRNTYPYASLVTENGVIKTGRTKVIKKWLLLLSFAVIMFLISFSQKNRNPKIVSASMPETIPMVEETTEIKTRFSKSICNDVFNNLKNKEKVIESISWSLSGSQEVVDLGLIGIHPLDLIFNEKEGNEKWTFSPVNYDKGEIAFSLNGKNEIYFNGNEKLPVEEKNYFINEIRNYLSRHNCDFVKEEIKNNDHFYSVSFKTPSLDFLKEAKDEIIFSANEYTPCFLQINQNTESGFLVNMGFAENEGLYFEEHPFNLLYEIKDAFCQKKKKAVLVQSKNEDRKENVMVIEKNPGKKIGKICHNDGSEFTYYKNEKGRIIHEKNN